MDIKNISIRNLGPIKQADIELGDLTVLVGQQATGKSIFLQTLKLLMDRDHIHKVFHNNNTVFKGRAEVFLDAYYGKNMSPLWQPATSINANLGPRFYTYDEEFNEAVPQSDDIVPINLKDYATPTGKSFNDQESVFYIPAQRVMSTPQGITQHFGTYKFGDPYVLRVFSDNLHQLLQTTFVTESDLSPEKLLPEMLGKQVKEQVYAGADLVFKEDSDYVRKLMLNIPDGPQGLPFLTWSAGQREFTPLLLGLYNFFNLHPHDRMFWKYVVIEEPEMGLHPQAINITLYMILNLLARGHKVLLSTHSPQALDMVWALRICQAKGGIPQDVLDIFRLGKEAGDLETAALALKQQYKVYYFQRSGIVEDISSLDPGSDNPAQAHWGGLTEFAGIAGDVVATVVNRAGF
jgi:energy-coupling factor transporter ATP-binding protein EcfA2